MEDKDKVNFDLDFLDKNAKEKPKDKPNSSKEPDWVSYDEKNKPDNDYEKGPSKSWMWVLGVIGFFILIGIFSGDSSSTSTSSSTPDGLVRVGQYMCSQYNANQADLLKPSDSETSIQLASSSLDQRDAELTRMRNEIDSSYVSEYSSQYEINQYNTQVDDYNSKLAKYKSDINSYNTRMDNYNGQVDKYNNYLKTHCTKQ